MNPSPPHVTGIPSPPPSREHLIPCGDFEISARHYVGTGSPSILIRGFPADSPTYGRLLQSLRGQNATTSKATREGGVKALSNRKRPQ